VNLPDQESAHSYLSQGSLTSEALSQPICIQLTSKELLALAGWEDRVRSWGWAVVADAETGSCRISRVPVVLNKPLGVSDFRFVVLFASTEVTEFWRAEPNEGGYNHHRYSLHSLV